MLPVRTSALVIFVKLYFPTVTGPRTPVTDLWAIASGAVAVVTGSGAIVTDLGAIVMEPGATVTDLGAIVTDPRTTVTRFGAIAKSPATTAPRLGATVTDPGAIVTNPGAIVTGPWATATDPVTVVPDQVRTVIDPGAVAPNPVTSAKENISAPDCPPRTSCSVPTYRSVPLKVHARDAAGPKRPTERHGQRRHRGHGGLGGPRVKGSHQLSWVGGTPAAFGFP